MCNGNDDLLNESQIFYLGGDTKTRIQEMRILYMALALVGTRGKIGFT